jgi:hypothetical protein
MVAELNFPKIDRTPLSLVGSIVEVRWSIANALSKKHCENCLYVVRGIEGDMICLELFYAPTDGAHNHDAIYWVNVLALQYLRSLTDKEAQRRVERLERSALDQLPKD